MASGLWAQAPNDGMWMSFDANYPYNAVTSVTMNVGDAVLFHQIANPTSFDPSVINLCWWIDTSLVHMDSMAFDVYDNAGNPFTWWIIWQSLSNATWTYQGNEVDGFAFLMLQLAGPTFALPASGSPWHIGVARMVADAPGSFVMDSSLFPPQNRALFGEWGGTNIILVNPVPVNITISGGATYDTFNVTNFGDTLVLTSPSSGDWDVTITQPGLADQVNSLHMVFHNITAGGDFSVSVANTWPPYTDMIKKYWYLNFTGTATSYDMDFYYSDADLVDRHGNPIDETTLQVWHWDPASPPPTPTSEGGTVDMTNNIVSIAGYTGSLSDWSLGGNNPTAVEEGRTIPKVFFVNQNAPNPFRGQTVISFGLPEATNVSLVVYNAVGQKVRTLVNGKLDAGYYDIKWNGTDDHGKPLSAGTYFFKMNAGTKFSSLKKMLLLR